jgi:ATP-dependent Clp protease adaptor protein ClpS
MSEREFDVEAEVLSEAKEKVEEPPMYRVLLHNDDFTTMEFVVWILVTVFHKDEAGAVQTMLQVHLDGVGIAGIYPYEVAEMKVSTVLNLATEHEYPLLCTLEPE